MMTQQIDAKSVQFLNAVRYYGNEANITEIRKMTGLNRNEANYRFRKLAEMGFIDVTREDSPGDLADRKVAHLTGKARRELERGLGSATEAGLVISDEPSADEVSRERFREMEQELSQLREALCAAAWHGRNNEGVPREEFEDLREYVYEWTETAEKYLLAIRRVIERYVPGVVSLDDHIEEKEE